MKKVKAPHMGESVSEAVVSSIKKKVGDSVAEGDILAVLETDKVNVEVYADVCGVVNEWKVAEGSTVHPDDHIATIEASSSVTSSSTKQQQAPQQAAVEPPVITTANPSASVAAQAASPAAAKIINTQGIDAEQIKGTGKRGMITKGDVLGHASNREEKRVRMSKLRQKVAERLKHSQNTAAMLTTFNEVDMTSLLEVRNKYKESFEAKHGVKLGFMSFFVAACARALMTVPGVNASIDGSEIIYRNYCDIGVAISSDSGLVVPILRNAESMSFADIEKAIVGYSKKAKSGALTIDDMTGGTFTVSNGGTFGSLLSTPIINPPQTAILGMHKTQERAVVVNGAVVVRPMMYLALSYDHRMIDGKEAVTFLVNIKQSIEDPVRVLLGL